MKLDRTKRLNSLLKEVISEVVRDDVDNPHVSTLVTITDVDVTKDLTHAKVYVSVIGSETEKNETVKALNSAAGFISVIASKKVVLRHFPTLTFKIDETVDKQMRIDSVIKEIHDKEAKRDE